MTRKQKILTIAFALFLTLSVITVTYAFFTAGGENQISSSVDITTGTLTLRLDDSDGYKGKVELNTIDPQNLTFTRRFEILNTGTVDAYAKVYWHDLVNSYLPGSLKYTLEESSDGTNFTTIITDRNVPRNAGTAKDAKLSNDLLIPTGNTPKYYKLTIRYDYSQTKDQSRDLSASFISGFTIVNGKEITTPVATVRPEDIPANHLRSQPYTINSSGDPARTNNNILGKTTYKDGSTIAETDFASITAVTTNVVPTDAIESWDVTASGGDSGSVMAWFTACANRPSDWNATNCYDLYIGQEGGVIAPNDMNRMFHGFRNTETINLNYFDTKYVTSMFGLFCGNYKLMNIDISSFDTSNVITMNRFFMNCKILNNIDLNFFDTSKVTNMQSMFNGCSSLSNLKINMFDLHNADNLRCMFQDCSKLTTLNINNWDTSNVTNMNGMFLRCGMLTSIDLSNFDTSSVTDMQQMFDQCISLTSLDVSNFDTSKVTTMLQMFCNCTSLSTIDVSNFDTSNVTNIKLMFGADESNQMKLTNIKGIENFDTSKVTTMYGIFQLCTKLTSLDLSKWDTSKVENMSYMFSTCSNLVSINVSTWNTSNVTDVQRLFANCSKLNSVDLSSFNLSKVKTSTSVTNMFKNCTSLTELTTPAVMSSQSIALATTLKDSNGNSYSALTSTTPTKTLLKSSWT